MPAARSRSRQCKQAALAVAAEARQNSEKDGTREKHQTSARARRLPTHHVWNFTDREQALATPISGKMIFDMMTLGLFVTLLFRLRDTYLSSKSGKKSATVTAKGSKGNPTPGEQEESKLSFEMVTQNQTTVSIFVGLIACLFVSLMLSFGGRRETAFSINGGIEADPSSTLTLVLTPATTIEEVTQVLGLNVDKPLLVVHASVDAWKAQDDVRSYARLREIFEALLAQTSGADWISGVVLAPFGGHALYSAENAAADAAAIRVGGQIPAKVSTVHGFSTPGPEPSEALTSLSLVCLSNQDSCKTAFVGQTDELGQETDQVQHVIRDSMLVVALDASRGDMGSDTEPASVKKADDQQRHVEEALTRSRSGVVDDDESSSEGVRSWTTISTWAAGAHTGASLR
ncbi:unnamed protein product [Durusdinium trenchii]|uniref:Uncharacterized protein n=1 Tax=Durusdinium trenchii TaxID=1381693 RepID=A0ABP0RUZ2_9DINO